MAPANWTFQNFSVELLHFDIRTQSRNVSNILYIVCSGDEEDIDDLLGRETVQKEEDITEQHNGFLEALIRKIDTKVQGKYSSTFSYSWSIYYFFSIIFDLILHYTELMEILDRTQQTACKTNRLFIEWVNTDDSGICERDERNILIEQVKHKKKSLHNLSTCI